MRAGRVLLGCALLISLQGCGALQARPDSFKHRLLFSSSTEQTKNTIREILGETPVRAAESGMLQTEWVEGWGDRRFGLMGGTWRRRFRLTIRLEPAGQGTRVWVHAQVEEKAPGGRLGLQWRRAASGGEIEKEFLDKLKQRLEPNGP